MPDFLIGAHALIDCDALIAFDRRYLRTMFKQLQVIVPMIDAVGWFPVAGLKG